MPNSWVLCRFSFIAEIFTGNSINETEKQKKYTGLTNGYNYIGTKDVSFDHTVNYNNGVKIPFEQSNFRIAHKFTPLLCIEGGSAGRKIGILQEDVCFGNKLCAFESFGVDPKYIYYFLQSPSFTKVFKEKTTGIIGGVSVNTLKHLLFAVPPLTEQARIVAEIEKFEPLITEYDKLEQQATKLDDEIYDKLKKSILQYAIQGKLVPRDPNDEPASVLLERIRAEKKAKLGKKYVDSYIYKGDDNCYYEHIAGRAQDELVEVPFDIPENWMWTRWGNLSFSIQYGYNAPAKEMGRIKMVRISDIHNNIVDWENVPFCEIKEEDISTYLLEENDILFARTGGTVGKSYLVTSIPVQAIYAGYLSFLLTAHPRAPLKSWRQTPLNFIFLPLKRTTPSFTQISRNPTFSPITSLPDSINRSYNTGVSALHARTSLHKKWTGIPSFASFFCPAILTLHSPRRAVKVSSPRLFVSIL